MKTNQFLTGLMVFLGISVNSFSQDSSILQRSKELSKWVQGDRYIKSSELILNARAEDVFPLLCPTLEYDWLNGWECTMYYSETGIAEKNCIFSRPIRFPFYKQLFYYTTEYIPNERIVFCVSMNKRFMMLMELDLEELSKQQCKLKMKYTLTGISKRGNKIVKIIYEKQLPAAVTNLEKDITYWIDNKSIRPLN
jgi:hypothetical protein